MAKFSNIERIAEFGDWLVYDRGSWAPRENCPRYIVGRNDSDGHMRFLAEFKNKDHALSWARNISNGPVAEIKSLRAQNAELRSALQGLLDAVTSDNRVKQGDYYHERRHAKYAIDKAAPL